MTKDLCWAKSFDESSLSYEDRLALAWCRLNAHIWDPFIGPKPPGFDSLPFWTKPNPFTGKRKPCKSDHVRRAMRAITSIIGNAAISKFCWTYELGEPEEEWLQWYISEDGPFK